MLRRKALKDQNVVFITSDKDALESSRPELPGPRPPRPPRRNRDPQRSIDEFWAGFSVENPGKAFAILPDNYHARRLARKAPKGVARGENAVTSFEEARATCEAKVKKIARECRRVNQKYRDPHFDIEFDLKDEGSPKDCLNGLTRDYEFFPESTKRVGDIFDEPRFYVDGATASDVRQGRDGDCWLMAALCTLSNKEDLIQNICVARDEAVGVYGFVFYRDGEWISEVIDDKLYLTKADYDEMHEDERPRWEAITRIDTEEEYRRVYQSGSGALYFAQCRHPNETWLPLLEKAYAKAHGDYGAIEAGFVGEAIEDLTAGVTTELFSSDILDKEKFWNEELMNVNKDFLFGCSTGYFREYSSNRKGIVGMHAYSIMRAVESHGERLLLLRNPWGDTEWNGPWSDGSEQWTPEWMTRLNHRFGDDGAFWISYKDLLRKYQHFDRTRLFGPDWHITQQWTRLDIPWTVCYHDTKFGITLAKESQVVIVLSQLDERYFIGLEGQYTFQLQFRVHKEGEEDYLVRSHGNYCMSRSVSTELTLEAGKYSVLMKVAATRYRECPTPDEVIRDTCRGRRDKLLQTGLSYDLAHAKVQRKEHEEMPEETKGKVNRPPTGDLAAKELGPLPAPPESNSMPDPAITEAENSTFSPAQGPAVAVTKSPTTLEAAKTKAPVRKGYQTRRRPSPPSLEAVPKSAPEDAPLSTPPTSRPNTPSFSTSPNNIDPPPPPPPGFLFGPPFGAQPPPPPPPPPPDSEDEEFFNDPWNAVCVVGLKVYTLGSSETEVVVIRPGDGRAEGSQTETGNCGGEEKGLDVDDGAKDAALEDVGSGVREEESEGAEVKGEKESEEGKVVQSNVEEGKREDSKKVE
ncbi:MAG: hypothetical protein M1819_001776 [Sarea resinae]|nr:MAG: hypothetical protein M1819_001776 [Sarea resinae]